MNDGSRGALEGAAGLCLARTNSDVEVEHILAKILEQDDTDLHKIASHYEINIDRLNKDVTGALDKLKTGNSRTPGLRGISDTSQTQPLDFGHEMLGWGGSPNDQVQLGLFISFILGIVCGYKTKG